MTEYQVDEIIIRPYDAQLDAERVKLITSEIWGGGNDALMEKEFGIIGGMPWSEWISQSVLSYFQAEGTRGFVAEKNGEVVGFCSYVIDENRSRGTVGYNGVERNQQGRGIGSAMLDFVLSRMKAEGMEYADVIVADNQEHLPALGNYEKHGFHRLTGSHHLVQKL